MTEVIVSDHAIVRYLERVDGPHPILPNGRIDVEAVRQAILADGRKEAFAAGVKNVRIGELVFSSKPDDRYGTSARIVTTVQPASQATPIKRPHQSNRRKPKDGRARKHQRREE